MMNIINNRIVTIILASGLAVSASAQEDRVGELEKQLRATQQLFAAEIAALQRPKDEKKPEGVPLLSQSSEKFGFAGYMQLRYDLKQGDMTSKGKKVDRASGFSVDRVRAKFEGNIDKATDYRFQLEVRQKTQFQLLDAWVGYAASSYIRPQIGQFQPKSQGDGDVIYRQFMDISNSSDTLCSESRDRGMLVGGLLMDKTLLYEVQLVNGNGIVDSVHDDTSFRWSVLMKYEPLGKMTPFQNDIEHGPLRIGLGASWSKTRGVSSKVGHQHREWGVTSFYGKWSGLYWKLLGAKQGVDRTSGVAKDQFYWSFQSGYSIPAGAGRILEPVVRYEEVNKDADARAMEERNLTVGLNYYLKGNNSRLQVNYVGRAEEGSSRIRNNSLEAGISVMF